MVIGQTIWSKVPLKPYFQTGFLGFLLSNTELSPPFTPESLKKVTMALNNIKFY